jgi:bifunctional non-homologous end joining protein LigD
VGKARKVSSRLSTTTTGQPVVLLGDWNAVPTDADICKFDTWRDNALL